MKPAPRRTLRLAVALFVRDESGQDLLEYALIAGLIALGLLTAMSSLSNSVSSLFSNVSSRLASAT